MILDYLKYFSRFPSRDGVLNMFVNGSSDLYEYEELKGYISDLPEPLVPDISDYVFGQRFDDVKKRVDSLTGTYLFCDFGEIQSSQDNIGSIQDTHKRAITVAVKLGNNSDMVEVAIQSDRTLSLLNEVRAYMILDSRNMSWLKTISESQTIVPFVAPELSSIGWSMSFVASASDWMNVKDITKHINSNRK
jgi:hypothetical protein